MFNGFTKEGLNLLGELQRDNTKEHFESKRELYEQYILNPNKAYVQEMGEMLQILAPNINAIAKLNKSLFKIYRDSRFHPSEPIKNKIGIIMWQGDGHRMQSSSFYMHYSKDQVFVATGIRNFKPPLLATYRDFVQSGTKRQELHSILQKLEEKGYSLPAAKFKRCPRELDCDDEHSYLYKMGAIYAYKTFKPNKTFLSSKIINHNFKIYQDMFDLHQWVYELTLHKD
jgi:uncharacterized protein (TIGR02453 family)